MKSYFTEEIRNIAVLGHGSSGKTTLCDALLYACGETDKIGSVADGTTVMDFDQEEKKRACSVSASVFSAEANGTKLNIIDAPGLFDYTAGVTEALTAADSAVIALSGKSGLNIGSELCYDRAKENGIPVAFFVGKLDSPRAHFYMVMSQLTGKYGSAVCPVTVPYVQNDEVVCYVDLITNRAFKCDGINETEVEMPQSADIENLRTMLIEAAASADEELMEKYFEGEELTADEITSALKSAFSKGEINPVFAGINATGDGIKTFLSYLVKLFPSPAEREYKVIKNGEETTIKANADAPCAAVVFKTVADPFIGRLSCFKVLSGKLKNDMKLINARSGGEERMAKVMFMRAAKQIDATEITAGDIGCTAKLGDVLTGDTLCAAGNTLQAVTAKYQEPCLKMAVYAVKKGEEEKIAQGMARLTEEDPTVRFSIDKETREMIIEGMGEQHLDVIKTKLAKKFGVEIKLAVPKVPYRETIKKSVKVQGRHKKQSGGHGQFGDVWVEFEPHDGGFTFEEKIFGGSVPKNFFPAVEKGLEESMQKGVLAGYPMVGVKATLVDGSYHPVDSSEMAFKLAANAAFKAGIPEAQPALLEPIGMLKVYVPDDYMGDVIGDITKRRGKVLGMDTADHKYKEIVAEVPMAEMGDFATAMRSITQGWATFSFSFERYEEAPPAVAKQVVEAAQQQ